MLLKYSNKTNSSPDFFCYSPLRIGLLFETKKFSLNLPRVILFLLNIKYLSKEEIRQEAVKYLRRFEDFDGNEIKMASFENWVEFISNKIEERFQSKQVYVFGTHTLAFDMNCYQEVIKSSFLFTLISTENCIVSLNK